MQRSNYAEASGSQLDGDEDEEGGGKATKGRARVPLSDKRLAAIDGGRKKKPTRDVRSAVLYRKNLATLIDESVCGERLCVECGSRTCLGDRKPPFKPPNVSDRGRVPSPRTEPNVVQCLRILGTIPVLEVCDGVLRHELPRRTRRDTMREANNLRWLDSLMLAGSRAHRPIGTGCPRLSLELHG
jgi:hypothetical protein